MQQLIQVVYVDLIYHLNCKKLLLSTYYALDETTPLFDLANTFKKLIANNKEMTTKDKKSYKNFILFLVRLYKIKMGGKKSLTELEQKINNTNENVDKAWLLKKIRELKKNRKLNKGNNRN